VADKTPAPAHLFQKGVSGNAAGRPKGSKNRVTILKLMAEEAVRSEETDRMLEVARLIIEQALEGDKPSQKLVWDAVMSKGSVDDRSQGQEKVQITISGLPESPKAAVIEAEKAEDAEIIEEQ
jgi:hypothetical protein